MLVKNMEFDDRLDDPRTPFYFDTKSVMENVVRAVAVAKRRQNFLPVLKSEATFYINRNL